MLDNINRSKATFLLIVLLFSACVPKFLVRHQFTHVEISCPEKSLILVRYVSLGEVKTSIMRNIDEKQKNKTSENYTVIYASGGRSVKIQNILPEQMIECALREIPVLLPDKNITKYTDY